mmetsp:Transcript_8996/g.20106  ORF Transcript_8996/g.20106 Transcript_8996/m.20106 type:complete len:162 (-) Transcript_8996:53-538(-)
MMTVLLIAALPALIAALPALVAAAKSASPAPAIVGYWALTWETHAPPPDATLCIAFSGWNDPANAVEESNATKDTLVGAKWIDAGGGNVNGRWNTTWIQKWETLIKSGGLASWDGIVLDVEECFETGLADGFVSLLHSAHRQGGRARHGSHGLGGRPLRVR